MVIRGSETTVTDHTFRPRGRSFPSNKDSSLLSPSLLPHGGHLSVEGGCGFCTEASPCVCADDFLDLSTQSQPSHIAVPSEVPSAVPLPKRTPGATPAASTSSSSTAAETSRRMSIGSLTHANDVALDERRRTITTNTKLWYTVSQPESPPASVPLTIKKTPKAGAGKKLWSVTPAAAQNSSPEPICTGDPSTCGACSTDPGLAAFCEAITTATTGATPSSSSTLLPPSAAAPSPIRPVGMARAGTTSLLPSSSTYTSSGETIPQHGVKFAHIHASPNGKAVSTSSPKSSPSAVATSIHHFSPPPPFPAPARNAPEKHQWRSTPLAPPPSLLLQ